MLKKAVGKGLIIGLIASVFVLCSGFLWFGKEYESIEDLEEHTSSFKSDLPGFREELDKFKKDGDLEYESLSAIIDNMFAVQDRIDDLDITAGNLEDMDVVEELRTIVENTNEDFAKMYNTSYLDKREAVYKEIQEGTESGIAMVLIDKLDITDPDIEKAYQAAKDAYYEVGFFGGDVVNKEKLDTVGAYADKIQYQKDMKVKNVKCVKENGSLRLQWDYVSGADGYYILKFDPKKKEYNVIADLASDSDSDTLRKYYTERYYPVGINNTPYKYYYYKVQAYDKNYSYLDKTISLKGEVSDYVGVKKKIGKVTGVKVSNVKKHSMTISWNKVKNASGYMIYRAGKDGKLKRIKTIKSGTKTKFVNTDLKSGKTYRYKVKAYYAKDGKRLTGDDSSIVKDKTKKAKKKAKKKSKKKSSSSSYVSYDIYVYITPTGKSYHTASCYIVRDHWTTELTLTEAVRRGYSACGRCH